MVSIGIRSLRPHAFVFKEMAACYVLVIVFYLYDIIIQHSRHPYTQNPSVKMLRFSAHLRDENAFCCMPGGGACPNALSRSGVLKFVRACMHK
jgi:hypothetical protein